MIFSFVADQLLHNKMSTSNQTVYSFQVHMVIIITTVVISNNNNNNNKKKKKKNNRRPSKRLC